MDAINTDYISSNNVLTLPPPASKDALFGKWLSDTRKFLSYRHTLLNLFDFINVLTLFPFSPTKMSYSIIISVILEISETPTNIIESI